MSWINTARRLRAQNHSFAEIANAVGVSKGRVGQVFKGTRRIRAPWHAQARRLRAAGASIAQIVKLTGKAHATVSPVVRNVVCPINHRVPGETERYLPPLIDQGLSPSQLKTVMDSIAAVEYRQLRDYRNKVNLQRAKHREQEALSQIDKTEPKTIKRLIRIIARKHKITITELLGRSQKPHMYAARADLMVGLRRHGQMSMPEIARIFGHYDHTAVLHTLKKFGLNGHLPPSP